MVIAVFGIEVKHPVVEKKLKTARTLDVAYSTLRRKWKTKKYVWIGIRIDGQNEYSIGDVNAVRWHRAYGSMS